MLRCDCSCYLGAKKEKVRISTTVLQLNQGHPGPSRVVPHEFQPPASVISSNLTEPTVQCEFVLMRVAQSESHFLFVNLLLEALVEWRGTVVVPAQVHAHTHAHTHACTQSVVNEMGDLLNRTWTRKSQQTGTSNDLHLADSNRKLDLLQAWHDSCTGFSPFFKLSENASLDPNLSR